jgi:hypothetical protein
MARPDPRFRGTPSFRVAVTDDLDRLQTVEAAIARHAEARLAATLRGYKAGAGRVLSESPPTHRYVAEYTSQMLDAAIAAVATDLDGDRTEERVM